MSSYSFFWVFFCIYNIHFCFSLYLQHLPSANTEFCSRGIKQSETLTYYVHLFVVYTSASASSALGKFVFSLVELLSTPRPPQPPGGPCRDGQEAPGQGRAAPTQAAGKKDLERRRRRPGSALPWGQRERERGARRGALLTGG